MDRVISGSRFGAHRSGGIAPRLVIALMVALFSVFSYCNMKVTNPVTGEVQHIDLNEQEEIALGLQASPAMAQQHGGLHPDRQMRERVARIGRQLVQKTKAGSTPYKFEFHLLRDEKTINAFALPGGQIFMTAGLAKRLQTDDEIAGVLGHEIGHVVAKHGAEHLAKQRLTQGLTGAAVIASYDPENPRAGRNAAIAMAIGSLVNMKFGRDDELESDRLGIEYMGHAGYDPNAMVRVMEVLAEASKGRSPPEFFSTHPNPENRIERIKLEIRKQFPNGVQSLPAEAISSTSRGVILASQDRAAD